MPRGVRIEFSPRTVTIRNYIGWPMDQPKRPGVGSTGWASLQMRMHPRWASRMGGAGRTYDRQMSLPSFDDLALDTARLWASRSADPKVQVGACLLDRWNRVVGVGYNGRAAGEPNERESLDQGHSGFIHAEVNALLAANWNGEGHTLFVTHERSYTETARADAGLPSGAQILRDAGLTVELGLAAG